MINRARTLAVIGRSRFPHTEVNRELSNLIGDWGIGNVLTDDALHALAMRIIWNRRQHNKFAAISRAHYAAKQESKNVG